MSGIFEGFTQKQIRVIFDPHTLTGASGGGTKVWVEGVWGLRVQRSDVREGARVPGEFGVGCVRYSGLGVLRVSGLGRV
jgi:hypothetical protein